MSTVSGTTLVHTGSHWGMYDVEVDNGRIIASEPLTRILSRAV